MLVYTHTICVRLLCVTTQDTRILTRIIRTRYTARIQGVRRKAFSGEVEGCEFVCACEYARID